MTIDDINLMKINIDYLFEYTLDNLTHIISLQQILLDSLINEKKGEENV